MSLFKSQLYLHFRFFFFFFFNDTATTEIYTLSLHDALPICEFSNHANVLRLTIGETQESERLAAEETIVILEANLDDLNPQVFGYVMDRALEEGALDAFGIPVQMKKNRPGMLLTILARPEDADKLTKLLFTETTTLGVRRHEEKRQALRRR